MRSLFWFIVLISLLCLICFSFGANFNVIVVCGCCVGSLFYYGLIWIVGRFYVLRERLRERLRRWCNRLHK